MSPQSDAEALQNMIMTFRVTELQTLLGFSGHNKNGKKEELQARAVQVLNATRSVPLQAKIRQLYKAAQAEAQSSMNMNGQQLQFSADVLQMMGLAAQYQQAGQQQQQQAAPAARNPYQAQAANYNAQYANQYQVKSGAQSQPANVKFKKLPFYDIHAELLQPTSLLGQSSSRFQEVQFQFSLSPSQATEIASNRDIRMGSKLDYLFQVQLRFCPLDTTAEQGDEFPPSICVQVNGKMCPLPNPIPTNKQGVEPKRPPRPINITPLCKLSPTTFNTINVKWACDFGKGWVVGIWMVEKLSHIQLIDRLQKKGTRAPEYTRGLIKQQLNDDDADIATDHLKVTVSCPLGKMRMSYPCRPSTCAHLQCFDAALFLQMNERKPTWQCPVCDRPAIFDTLLVDGYFLEVIKSKELPEDENDIILKQDGGWEPCVQEDDAEKKKAEEKKAENEECIDLSDEEGGEPIAPTTPADLAAPVPPPEEDAAPLLPPLPPAEIECIDLE